MTSFGSAKKAGRTAVNDPEAALMTVDEQILQQIHKIYVPREPDANELSTGKKSKQQHAEITGLQDVAASLGLEFLPPRKKVTVMIIGNHSAGKSSFINWYIGEHVQRTGVAIETTGFTIVTSGKQDTDVKGEGTLLLYPHLQNVKSNKTERFPGFVSHLSTRICTSKENKFPLVDFIDTPGLADGNLNYPFDVDSVMLWMANHVDLIFVFFDPIGQALCSRTMNIVQHMHARHSEKMRYYMTKADQVTSDIDRYKVVCQITQNLTARIQAVHAFDLPPIFIPELEGVESPPPNCINRISEMLTDIERTINQKVQANLNTLEQHCGGVIAAVDKKLSVHSRNAELNSATYRKSWSFFFLAMVFPLFMVTELLSVLNSSSLGSVLSLSSLPASAMAPVKAMDDFITAYIGQLNFWVGSAGCFLLFYFVSKCLGRTRPVLSSKEVKALKEHRVYAEHGLKRKEELYKRYFDESVNKEFDS